MTGRQAGRGLLAILLPIVAACSFVSREARIEARLEQSGLKPRLARCMAPKLEAALSDDELATLANTAHVSGDTGHHAISALAARLATLDDPHIADVISRAGLGCAILG